MAPPPLRVPPLPPANFNRDINPAFRNRPYRLGPGDQITVQVQRFPELGFTGPISPEGVIVLPLIGTVNVRGLTVEESQQRLRERFGQFIKNPQISAALVVQRPVVVTVTGEVARPGFYPLQTPQLPAALAAAAGTTPTAELRAVRVRRTLPGGAVAEQVVDILTPLQTGIAPPDLRLEDGDAIVVPYKQVTPDRKSDQDLASRYSLAAAPVPRPNHCHRRSQQTGFLHASGGFWSNFGCFGDCGGSHGKSRFAGGASAADADGRLVRGGANRPLHSPSKR